MPSRRSTKTASGQVIIAVDPHKVSWTAVAVDSRLQPLDAVRVPVSRGPLTSRLADDGIEVIDVSAKLARRVRLLSTGHGRKSDEADALSVGVAAHTADRLHTARVEEAVAALRTLTEHRDDLVRTRTQTVNRLHALMTKLVPAGLPRKLTADTAAAAL
ncbi:transposase [Streptomyces monticola]|uniref:Transposase n=1 Tax=Streptomyces monticola TaxID=2666263 RepID=A0ABW2JUA5_9ACTN